jgi:hypothetical protein
MRADSSGPDEPSRFVGGHVTYRQRVDCDVAHTKRAAPESCPFLPRSFWRLRAYYEVFLSCATSASRILMYSVSLVWNALV